MSTINNNFHKSNDNLENATHLLKNASKFLELTKNGLVLAEDKFNDGFMINDQVNKTLNEHIDDMNNIRNLTDQAEKHQNELLYMVNILKIIQLMSCTRNIFIIYLFIIVLLTIFDKILGKIFKIKA